MKLWLHVGPPKTGTTTIQRFFHANRKALERRGIIYPRAPKNPHHKAAFAHHFLPSALLANDWDLARGFVTDLPHGDIVLSSERFMKAAQETAELVQGLDVTAIFYARDPVEMANSMAQQIIKAGKKSYAQLAKYPPKLSPKDGILRWTDALGKDRVIVRPFSRSSFPEGDLIADFFQAIGRSREQAGLPREKYNESISLEMAHRIDAYRAETGDRAFIKAGDKRFYTPGGEPFRLPEEALSKVRKKVASDLVWLRQTYGIEFTKPSTLYHGSPQSGS